MKNGFPLILASLMVLFLGACKSENDIPDVSGVKVEFTTRRFEKDFFAMDTSQLPVSLEKLSRDYPLFTKDFVEKILGIPLQTDNPDAMNGIRQFIRDYIPINRDAEKLDENFARQEKEIRQGLQFVKYYFPKYKAPDHLISYVGPMDAYFQAATGGYGDVITENALAVGLQLHLGSQSPYYTSVMGQQLYPDYISRRFEPAYISVNCMKNIIDDMYPDQSTGKPLMVQMVDKGKRMYLLDKLLPYAADSLKLGYTNAQLNGCFANEGLIWNFFVENNLLYESDYMKIRSYISDGPKTDELGDGSPGFISLFVGRQIIRAYMSKFPKTSLEDLLKLDAQTIFNEAKYKPR